MALTSLRLTNRWLKLVLVELKITYCSFEILIHIAIMRYCGLTARVYFARRFYTSRRAKTLNVTDLQQVLGLSVLILTHKVSQSCISKFQSTQEMMSKF